MIRTIVLLCAISAVAGFVGHATVGYGRHYALQSKNDDVFKLMLSSHQQSCEVHSDPTDGDNISQHRRTLLLTTITMPAFLTAHPNPSNAAKLRPDDAYASLVKARSELQYAAQTYLPKRDWEGLKTYLTTDAVNMNNYEVSAQALLESKRLDAESKRDIGTIRRYGVGADVIIMYGGLKGELGIGDGNGEEKDDNDEEEESKTTSYTGVEKYLRRTMESLDEVLAICRSNGFE